MQTVQYIESADRWGIFMKSLGERIVFLREEHDISQKELAITVQITAATLSRYENNLSEPNAAILCRLANALSTSADFLLGLCDYYTPSTSNQKSSQFTAREYSLLNSFRLLSSENQIRVEERIETLLSLSQK